MTFRLKTGQAKLFAGGREVPVSDVRIGMPSAVEAPKVGELATYKHGEPGVIRLTADGEVKVTSDDDLKLAKADGHDIAFADPSVWESKTPADPIKDLQDAIERSSRQMPSSSLAMFPDFVLDENPPPPKPPAPALGPVQIPGLGMTIPATQGMKERIARIFERAHIDAPFAALVERFRQVIELSGEDDPGSLRDAFDLALAYCQAPDDIVEHMTIDLERARVEDDVTDMLRDEFGKMLLQARTAKTGTGVAMSVARDVGVAKMADIKHHVESRLAQAVRDGIIASMEGVKVEVDPNDSTRVNIEAKVNPKRRTSLNPIPMCAQCNFFEGDQDFGQSAGVCHRSPALQAKQAIDSCPMFQVQKCAACKFWQRDQRAIGPTANRSSTSGVCAKLNGPTEERDACEGWIRREVPPQIQSLGEIVLSKRKGH